MDNTQFEIQKELLELSIKAGRRMMHDFKHMLNEIPYDNPERVEYQLRANMWESIFYPDDGMKNYRNRLHKVIQDLERDLNIAHKLLKEHGIDPEPHKPF